MDSDVRMRQLAFRAWHRGTREADYLVGGLFDKYHDGWSADELAWFERLIEEQDVDILNWAMGLADPPPHIDGPMLSVLRRLDYIDIAN